MTEAEARQWVLDEMEADQSELDDDELRAAWTALYEREPDDEDMELGTCGLWTQCVQAVQD